LAAADRHPTFTWLDAGVGGGEDRGWLGLTAAEEIVADDLSALDEVDARWRADRESIWLGWLTYDVGADAHLGRTAAQRGRSGRLPGLCVRRFDRAWQFGSSGVTVHGRPEPIAPSDAPPLGSRWPFEPLSANVSPAEYRKRVAKAQRFITAGDTYQINLSQRFDGAWKPGFGGAEDVASAYMLLRERTPASMGGLVRFDGGWVLSNSPETLLDVRLGEVDVARSWPIKGTRPRGSSTAEDDRLRDELVHSVKDRAEHVMIVDLVRNDLGRLARPGTVRAQPVPSGVSLPTVHHLVTEVRAELTPGWTLRDLVEAMFPGGSITGAPKHRTIELIDALEGEPRELYCGSLFVLEPTGLRFDIAIRTAIVDDAGLSVRGGGGIVMDSDPEAERLETLAKVKAFAG
jgi:anthranilate/para-aminobenzoate synthase component I